MQFLCKSAKISELYLVQEKKKKIAFKTELITSASPDLNANALVEYRKAFVMVFGGFETHVGWLR